MNDFAPDTTPVPEPVKGNALALAAPREARQLATLAETLVIEDGQMFAFAGGELRELVAKRKAIEEARLAITRPMDAAKKAVMDFFAAPLNALQRGEDCIRGKMATYERIEHERREEERREAEARARAEQEAAQRVQREAEAKARAEADRARRAQEEAARLEREASAAAAAAANAADRERIEAEARERQEALRQETEAAQAAQDQAENAAVVARDQAEQTLFAPLEPVTAAPVAEGVSFRTTWSGQLMSLKQLVDEAARNPERLTLLMVNQPALNALARSSKGAITIPGIRFVATRGSAVRK